MTNIKDGKITYDNFMEKIDTGVPEAVDSGRVLSYLDYCASSSQN